MRCCSKRIARAGNGRPRRLERGPRADAADRGSRHWINLQRLVQRTLPTLRRAAPSTAPILLVSAGLLARYDLMTLITEVEEHAGRPGHTPSGVVAAATTHRGPAGHRWRRGADREQHPEHPHAGAGAGLGGEQHRASVARRSRLPRCPTPQRKEQLSDQRPQLLADLTRLLKAPRRRPAPAHRRGDRAEGRPAGRVAGRARRRRARPRRSRAGPTRSSRRPACTGCCRCVFLRFIEDNELVERPGWAAPESDD